MQQTSRRTSVSKSADKRALLIDIGTAIFTQKGFNNTALDELVKAANVPKGSFYYYFGSKDNYAQAVIQNYADYFRRKLDRLLSDTSMSPISRLKAFTDEAIDGVTRFEFKRGCLVGNLGQEMASLDEGFRQSLAAIMHDWHSRFSDCLEEAKKIGEITTEVDSLVLAQFFWASWEGAILCARLERSIDPMKNVVYVFFEHVLKPVSPENDY